jgi:hypothetical protein
MNLTRAGRRVRQRFPKAVAASVLACGATLAAVHPVPANAGIPPQVLDSGVPKPASVIYIGSSFFYYNNGINNMVSRLLASADPQYKLSSVMVTISGSGFDWHDVDSYFRPNAIARYTIDAQNKLSFNQRDPLFKLAVMMDCSQCPLHPGLERSFTEFAQQNSATVRKHGAQPVFFMSWAYLDKPEMTQPLADAYTQVGNDNKALVIPAGLAFARAVRQRPDLSIYMQDKRHPTLAGSYLAAATTYATILRKSPVGLRETMGLDKENAQALQAIA